MSLQDLYYYVSITEDTKVLNREFSAYGIEYALAGMVNTNDRTELVLLEFDKRIAEDNCCAEPESMTNREIALSDTEIHKGLSELLMEVIIGDCVFEVAGLHGCSLDCGLDNSLYAIVEFMKQGWKSEKFFDYPTECIFVNFIELDKKIEPLKQFDLSQAIKLIAYETTQNELPDIKLNLPVEQDIDKKISLFGGNEEICIKRVHLVDLSKSQIMDEARLSVICPNSMRVPVIEYTCGNDELYFDISLSSYLDSICGDSCNGFETEDGVSIISVQLETDNKASKFFTIQQTVKADTKYIECEVIRCSKEIESPHIEEILI